MSDTNEQDPVKTLEYQISRIIQQGVNMMPQIMKLIEDNRLDPFMFVQPCEEDCSPERHAYHQGQWDMAVRIDESQKNLLSKEKK
jgi:hypothetical protein